MMGHLQTLHIQCHPLQRMSYHNSFNIFHVFLDAFTADCLICVQRGGPTRSKLAIADAQAQLGDAIRDRDAAIRDGAAARKEAEDLRVFAQHEKARREEGTRHAVLADEWVDVGVGSSLPTNVLEILDRDFPGLRGFDGRTGS